MDVMYKFILKNGSDKEVVITGDMFDDEAVATERAGAEFVEGSYTYRGVSFTTYRTDIALGSIISVRGVPFKVIELSFTQDSKKLTCDIKGERYEN